MPAIPTEAVNAIGTFLTRGVFQAVTERVAGAMKSRLYAQAEDGLPRTKELAELPDLDEEGMTRLGSSLAPNPPLSEQIPPDLFDDIVGHGHEKAVLMQSLRGKEKMHVLLVGPPASGKSQMLDDMRRNIPGTRYIVGRNLTSSGLREVLLASNPPDVLLVDEIDKADEQHIGTLLTVMDGRVTEAVHGRHADEDTQVRVIAACNELAGPVKGPLQSRFVILRVKAYTPEERRQVIEGFLVKRKGMRKQDAQEIARLMAPKTATDVRDAEQVAGVWNDNRALAMEMIRRMEAAPTSRRKQPVSVRRGGGSSHQRAA